MGVAVDLHLGLDLYNLARRDEDFCSRKRSDYLIPENL